MINPSRVIPVIGFVILWIASLPYSMAMDNVLSPSEKEQGWQLLFNGKDMSNWRNFKNQDLNENWVLKNGIMHLNQAGGGDIITKKIYENFILKLEWKISEAGNSGIFIMANELGNYIYSSAPEIQILDNERHSDNKIASHLSGSIFDIIASPETSHKLAGEWNKVKIYLHNRHLKVWQNGVQTADIVIGSDKWNKLIKQSKFKDWQGFAETSIGHIGFQDHGDPVSFKNIKILVLE